MFLHALTPLLCILIVLPTSLTDWTSECVARYPASCRCTWSSGKRSADCQKSNMNALPVLSNDIQILEFSNNKLPVLQDNAFTNANLINLQKLYLKGCRITKIHELAFNNLRILIEVDLSYNEIEYVDPVIFQTNVRVRVIKLNNNKLHTVREFPVLEYLSTLDLSYNLIGNFSYHTFVGLRNLKVLDLSYNQFTNLNPEILPRLSSLMLRGNNWVCDCELKPLRDYVIANKFNEVEIKCNEPLSLFASPWDAFDELSCKPEILHILANGKVVDSIVALESTLVLSCVVRGEPLPDVKWVKNGRVVQEALMSVAEGDKTVMLNLTLEGRKDSEFVCVGSNSGGVVERNLTVTVDEAGLSGFVVLKDGVDRENGMMTGFRGERGSLVIYLVIGVVFLSLVVGLVVGGVCVWKWGKIRGDPGQEGDTVVKSVIKDEGGGGKVTDERGDMVVMSSIRGGGSVQGFAEQVPFLKAHTSADDLLDTHRYVNGRPTPDLLINGGNGSPQEEDDDLEDDDMESVYSPGKFPQGGGSGAGGDNTSIYDNYELMYNKPLLTGADSLRRYAFLRNNTPYGVSTVMRPSSVCSEGGHAGRNSGVNFGTAGTPTSGGGTVILPHGYVTLPRRSMRDRSKGSIPAPTVTGVIKYDNLGPRSGADGCSNFSLNKCGVDSNGVAPHHQAPPPADLPHYSNIQQLQDDLYDQLNAVQSPQQREPNPSDYIVNSPLQVYTIPEDETEEPLPPEEKKKYRPVPPPKPKKRVAMETTEQDQQQQQQNTTPCSSTVGLNDDDGTEV